jgi:hypothetical protein
MTGMPEHGDYDSQKWYCVYWMTEQEWLDVHDYSPPVLQPQEENKEEQEEE